MPPTIRPLAGVLEVSYLTARQMDLPGCIRRHRTAVASGSALGPTRSCSTSQAAASGLLRSLPRRGVAGGRPAACSAAPAAPASVAASAAAPAVYASPVADFVAAAGRPNLQTA